MITLCEEAQTLSKASVFGALSTAQLRQLAFASDRIVFPDGKTILHPRQDPDCAFLILEGEADVFMQQDGLERFITKVGKGFVLGEIGMITETPHKASAIAKGRVQALRINRSSFIQMLEGNKSAMTSILRSLAQRKAEYEEQFSIKLD